MLKKIKSKRLKILVVVIAVAVLLFLSASIVWAVFYNIRVMPFADNFRAFTAGLPEKSTGPEIPESYCETRENGSIYCDFQSYNRYCSSTTMIIPRFLDFNLIAQAVTPYEFTSDSDSGELVRLTDYVYSFLINRKFFCKTKYSFYIDDYTDKTETYENGVYESSGPAATYYIEVDKDMNFLSGNKAMYEEHYDELKRVYDEVKEIFGENAFE